ncbi:MAG: hypothetical protein ABI648_02245 [Betaproteobacteria bacterium]
MFSPNVMADGQVDHQRIARAQQAGAGDLQVNARVLMPEFRAQLARQVAVALAGLRIDVCRRASPVALRDVGKSVPQSDFAPHPVQFRKRLGTVEVNIGAKSQRIERLPPAPLQLAHACKVDQGDVFLRLVRELVAVRPQQPRCGTQPPRHKLEEKAAERRPAGGCAQCKCVFMPIRSADVEFIGRFLIAGEQAGDLLVQHQHHENRLGQPRRCLGVESRVRAQQGILAVEGKSAAGRKVHAGERFRTQTLDRVAIEACDFHVCPFLSLS